MAKELVFEKGQKFEACGKVWTAHSFYGRTGIEYPTASEAIMNNDGDSLILVKNVEKMGSTDLLESFLITNQ